MDWTSVLPSGLVISSEQGPLKLGGMTPGGSTSTPTQNRIDSPSRYFGFSSRRTGRIATPTLCAQVLSGAKKYEATRHRRPACTNAVDRRLAVFGRNIEISTDSNKQKALIPPRNAPRFSQPASPRQLPCHGGSASCGVLPESADSPANPSEESPE